MSSPATVSEYGKFIDLQTFNAAAPEKSGSLYLSGAAGAELMRMNVGLATAGNVTAVGSFIIGSADMSEADLEKLDGITNGTVAASKAVVVDANKVTLASHDDVVGLVYWCDTELDLLC